MQLDKRTKRILKDPEHRRAWVIYQLSLSGNSLAAVAEQAGVKRQTMYGVFSAPYPRMEAVVASALGITPQQLFPERYDENGLPNRKMGRPKKNRTTKKAKNNTRANHCNERQQDAA